MFSSMGRRSFYAQSSRDLTGAVLWLTCVNHRDLMLALRDARGDMLSERLRRLCRAASAS